MIQFVIYIVIIVIFKYKVSTDPHSTYLGHYLMRPEGYSPDFEMGRDRYIQCSSRLWIPQQQDKR